MPQSSSLDSSWLEAASWENGTLTVRGRGRTMTYTGVPRKVYEDLTRAVSPGKYFNWLIKPKYRGG